MRIRTIALAAALAAGISVQAQAAGESVDLLEHDWNHTGLFGTFDRAAAQRGLQIYRQVCASCHGLEYVAFRTLTDLGFSEEQVQAIAADYSIEDGPNDAGEMFEREGRPSDTFPSPFDNEAQARMANGGAYPLDLSLITKARADGTNYLYSLLQGYVEPPADEEGRQGQYYNAYFPGHWIGMPSPLIEGIVEYSDGTEPTIDEMARDVSVFLTWAAEPTLEERKQTGLKVTLFLIVITGLLFATKRRVWADVH